MRFKQPGRWDRRGGSDFSPAQKKKITFYFPFTGHCMCASDQAMQCQISQKYHLQVSMTSYFSMFFFLRYSSKMRVFMRLHFPSAFLGFCSIIQPYHDNFDLCVKLVLSDIKLMSTERHLYFPFFRPDCVQILKQCSNSSATLAALSPEEVCKELSPPEKKAPCISLQEYLGM